MLALLESLSKIREMARAWLTALLCTLGACIPVIAHLDEAMATDPRQTVLSTLVLSLRCLLLLVISLFAIRARLRLAVDLLGCSWHLSLLKLVSLTL